MTPLQHACLVRRGVEADLLCGAAEERRGVGVEAERAEEVVHRVGRCARSDPGDELSRLVAHATAPIEDFVRALIEALVEAHAADPELHELMSTTVPHGVE